MTPPLIAVAHGSRDPRSAATVDELVGAVRALRQDLDVRLAFLDLSAPRLTDVLAGVHADGHDSAVVVPLLLGSAFHARVDVPGIVAATAARCPRLAVTVADVLGPDPRLEDAALDRLASAGADLADGGLGLLLAGAGSSHAAANAAVAAVAGRWRARTGRAATAAFASTGPDVATGVRTLRDAGCRHIAVGSWFLAPGLLPDRISHAVITRDTDAVLAAPLGADHRVAAVVLDRYAAAGSRDLRDLRSA